MVSGEDHMINPTAPTTSWKQVDGEEERDAQSQDYPHHRYQDTHDY
jgi:uncharacterized protein YfaP (DUF2135 family)